MLKNLKKAELLEMLYKLEGERDGLIDCYKKQSEVLRQVAETTKSKRNWFSLIINFFVLPFKIAAVLRNNNEYFFTLKIERMNYSEEQIMQAYGKINEFENKQLAPKAYKEYVAKLLGLKDAICDTCGDVMDRLHSDFQKRINNEAKRLGNHLLKPIKFESGKYHEGGFYENRVPVLSYSDLRKLCLTMKNDVKRYAQRSLTAQSKLIAKDMKTLQTYIVEKLNGNVDEAEEIVLDTSKSNEVDSVAAGVKADKKEAKKIEATKEAEATKEVEKTEATPEVIDNAEATKTEESETENADDTEATPEVKNEYSNVDAAAMKEQGMTLKEIGSFYGIAPSTVSGRLKKHEKSLEAEK